VVFFFFFSFFPTNQVKIRKAKSKEKKPMLTELQLQEKEAKGEDLSTNTGGECARKSSTRI